MHSLTSVKRDVRFYPNEARRVGAARSRPRVQDPHESEQERQPGRMTSLREPDAGWRDRLTVIITTSPLPRHPCSSMLEAILLSLRGFGGLAGCRTLIVADGYEASAAEGQAARWKKGKISEEAAARYEQHKQRVRAACESGAPPFEQATSELIPAYLTTSAHISPYLATRPYISRYLAPPFEQAELIEQFEHRGFALGVRRAVPRAEPSLSLTQLTPSPSPGPTPNPRRAVLAASTEFVLVVQHDRPLRRHAPLAALIEVP